MDSLLLTFADLTTPLISARIFILAFLAILFLQSGFDKVMDWKGNLSWLKEHFAQSMFKGQVPFLLGTIMVFEIAAGIITALGLAIYVFQGTTGMAILGIQLSAISFLMLFFGQRIAKDYAGAWTLATYFILVCLGLALFHTWPGGM
ncbi:MAG: DoxX family protein [Bacteroidota bacterium]